MANGGSKNSGGGAGIGLLGGFNLPGLTGGASGPAISGGNPLFNERNAINIAPSGVNLGAILLNYDAPPENGGIGIEQASRYLTGSRDTGSPVATAARSAFPVVLVVAAAAGAVILFRKAVR